MIKRVFKLMVAAYALSIILHSCEPKNVSPIYYYWQNFDFELYDTSKYDEFFNFLPLDVNNPFEMTKLCIHIFIAQPAIVERSQARTFNIISAAYALSPEVKRAHDITDIVIKAKSVDSEVVEEIDITSLFKGTIEYGLPEVSIEEFINLLNGHYRWHDRFILFLREDNPEVRGKQVFEITITFDDGVVLVRETEELTLV